jgi:NTE family protein
VTLAASLSAAATPLPFPAQTAARHVDGLAGREMRQPLDVTTDAATDRTAPPVRLALVLGSGGVRAVAALGVAEVLQEAGLAPDLIVGCSAGAIFGALIAAGHRAEAAQGLARTLWSREVTSQRRRRAWLEIALGPIVTSHGERFAREFALRDDRLILERLQRAFGEARLEDLPTPMRVNATDAHSGAPVLLTRGRVCDALRASIALPFLFAPHSIEGRLLVDGSVCDPLPLGAAAHADVVLGLGFEIPTPRTVTGPTRLATRITAALTNNLMQARMQAHAGPTRITLLPALERRVGLFDTDAMPELIDVGRRAAREALPQLQRALKARGEAMRLHPRAA